MAVKSIIEIDVRDERFARFTQLWEKYKEALAKTPDSWAKVGEEQEALGKSFSNMNEMLLEQLRLSKELSEEDEHRVRRLRISEGLWTSIAKSGSSLAKSILDVSSGVLKWGGFVGGLATGASLFGLDRLAEGASDRRRAALGLNTSVGEMRSFDINFGRTIDPGFLTNVSNMESDPSQSWRMMALGVNPTQNPVADSVNLLNKIRRLAQQSPNLTGMYSQLYGIGNTQEWNRMANTGDAEWNKQISNFQRDASGMNIGDKTGMAWQDLTTRLDAAKEKITDVFIKGLVPLAPAFEKLSDAVTKVIQHLFPANGNGPVQKGIEKFAAWVADAADKLTTADFTSKIDEFVSATGELADAIKTASDVIHHPLQSYGNYWKKEVGREAAWLGSKLFNLNDPATTAGLQRRAMGEEMIHKLPEGLLWKMVMAESGGNPNAISDKGALGLMQLMPETAMQYHVSNPFDPAESLRGGADKLATELKHYKNDLAKALAAYNWGENNVDAAISKYGSAWGTKAPLETRNYVKGITGTDITVINKTGGQADVAVTATGALGAASAFW